MEKTLKRKLHKGVKELTAIMVAVTLILTSVVSGQIAPLISLTLSDNKNTLTREVESAKDITADVTTTLSDNKDTPTIEAEHAKDITADVTIHATWVEPPHADGCGCVACWIHSADCDCPECKTPHSGVDSSSNFESFQT